MRQLSLFIFFILLISGCHKSTPCEKEIYLLPDGFKGTMIVYFDQPDGEEIQYEDDARVYNIPTSGFLKTKFLKNGGCMNDGRLHFYYKDSLGNREPLDYFLDLHRDSIPKDRDYVLFTFLSNKESKPDFMIHLVGHVSQFNELTQSIHLLEPVKLLESINQ